MKVRLSHTWLVVVILSMSLLGAIVYVAPIQQYAKHVATEVWLTLSPSAEAAYTRGVRHFDARTAQAYDIEQAEQLFLKAFSRDPEMPFVRHQLARIAFLRGDFAQALKLIDEEIALPGGPKSTSSFYVKGLIEGFKGDYKNSARDYATYLRSNPTNWAALNDYAWVLLKDNRPREALIALDWGLMFWPENPWLHNSRAVALYELDYMEKAYDAAKMTLVTVGTVTKEDWLQAYPGNDPLIAQEGLQTFRKAAEENMHSMELARTLSDKNM